MKNSSSYWLGNNKNVSLQRVNAVSFYTVDELKKTLELISEQEKRDHRHIATQQELFMFSDYSPGSCFFLPDGAHIYNKLLSFIRDQYSLNGFSEVITPNLFNLQLWKTSGHYKNYKENLFLIKNDKEILGLKPMNCPAHCLMYNYKVRSYKELPIRFADFGALHRNEVTGALSGLTRVRRFQQDDAHIFCTDDQILNEIMTQLKMLDYIYGVFNFKYKLLLSTRPDKYLGKIELWNKAENSLKQALTNFGKEFEINEGDGAFYG